MCGICGVYNRPDASEYVRKALHVMQQRGKEAAGIYDGTLTICATPQELPYSGSTDALGHLLHAMVGCVPQPLVGKGVLVVNGEIYNWEELCTQHKFTAQNDAEVLLKLLDKYYPAIDTALAELDGVYAFAYERADTVTLARDILGVKPLFYAEQYGFAFASERKALRTMSITQSRELSPRTILTYDKQTKTVQEKTREFLSLTPELTAESAVLQAEVQAIISRAVEKRIPKSSFGLLLSGGVDSSTLAVLLQKHQPRCYVVGDKESPDVLAAQTLAKQLNLSLTVLSPSLDAIKQELPHIIDAIEDANPVKVSVATTFWFACQAARKDGCRALFSGLGSEEVFAGYERHRKSTALNKECLAGLRKLHDRDLYRDDVITMRHGIELRLPFLDKALVQYGLRIPATEKLTEHGDKWILRQVALALGVPQENALRPKKAAQYGSKIMKQLETLAKGHASVSAYLATFRTQPNKRLAALLSGGKDSVLALHIMQRMHYEIACCVTIASENPDSFMFHTPNTSLTALQAKAMRMPLVTAQTTGEKEQELQALRDALKKARDEYHSEGVVVGAIQSQYQRERVETIADALGLTVFAPLWQMDQVAELRTLLAEHYSVIFTKVAADGLDASWLGTALTAHRIEQLEQLHKTHGVHPAGEGGEYESLVLDAPLFEEKLILRRTETIKDGLSATLHVLDAGLTPK